MATEGLDGDVSESPGVLTNESWQPEQIEPFSMLFAMKIHKDHLKQ